MYKYLKDNKQNDLRLASKLILGHYVFFNDHNFFELRPREFKLFAS